MSVEPVQRIRVLIGERQHPVSALLGHFGFYYQSFIRLRFEDALKIGLIRNAAHLAERDEANLVDEPLVVQTLHVNAADPRHELGPRCSPRRQLIQPVRDALNAVAWSRSRHIEALDCEAAVDFVDPVVCALTHPQVSRASAELPPISLAVPWTLCAQDDFEPTISTDVGITIEVVMRQRRPELALAIRNELAAAHFEVDDARRARWPLMR
jgi:hypothetical protein